MCAVSLLAGCLIGAAPIEPIVLCDNAGWCWFEDERVVVHRGVLVVGTVADVSGAGGAERDGDIQVTAYHLATGALVQSLLHARLQADDHNSPAFLAMPDGRLLAAYAKHGSDRFIRLRTTTDPLDPGGWGPEQTIEREAGVTYSNLFSLGAENGGRGRLYDFYRGEGFDPNYIVSDDGGETWRYGGRLLYNLGDERNRIRPYVKYAGNGRDTVHFVTTEGHPQSEPASNIYHGFLRDGKVHRSDGTVVRDLAEGPVDPTELTPVYLPDPAHRAWTVDLHLDPDGRPVTVFSEHRSSDDHRYHYARWDGAQWRRHEIAYAGVRLYPREEHYTGLAALDPHDLNTVYISTNADPVSGEPLLSAADGQRHYELFHGVTRDGGASFTWTAVTRDSTVDNLRPIIPIHPGGERLLLWLRGNYTAYTDFDQQAVLLRLPRE